MAVPRSSSCWPSTISSTEYRLMVYPIVLGAGKRLFSGTSHTATLRLVDACPVGPDGVVVLTYQPADR